METQSQIQNPQAPQMAHLHQAIAIPERRDFIPAWCAWKAFYYQPGAPELALKVWTGREDSPKIMESLGVPIEVGMVLPERRFAIEPDGRLRDARDFWELCELKYVDTFVLAGVKQVGDPSLIPKPNPLEFISYTVDPIDPKKKRQIGHDPNKPPPAVVHRRSEIDAIKDPVAMPQPGLVHVPKGVTKEESRVSGPAEQVTALKQLLEDKVITEQEYGAQARKIAEDAGWVVASASQSGGNAASEESTEDTPSVSSASPSGPSPLESSRDQVPTNLSSKDGIARGYDTKCGRRFSKPWIVKRHERSCNECVATEE